mmetsp:Transcript_10793/g.23817  ORF Transcript_10793/g.23817 Transcript_10793/m.23817 type:complete len:1114 (+) Transcript_10793:450-3791(+)
MRSELRSSLVRADHEVDNDTTAAITSSNLEARLIVIGEASDHSACILLEVWPNEDAKLAGEPIYLMSSTSGVQTFGTPKEFVQNSSTSRLLDGKPVVYCFENLQSDTKYTIRLNSAISGMATLSKEPTFYTLRSESTLRSKYETIQLGFTGGNRFFEVDYNNSAPGEDPWAGLLGELQNLDLLVHLGNSVLQDDTSQLWRRSVTGEGLSDEEDRQVLQQCMWCQAQQLLEDTDSKDQWNKLKPQIEELFRSTYRKTWSQTSMATILTSIPNIFLMDQHEVRSNWGAEEMDITIGSRTRWLAKVAFSIAWEYEYSLLLGTGFAPSFSSRYDTRLGQVGLLRLETRFANLDDNDGEHQGAALQLEKLGDLELLSEPARHRPGHSSSASELLLGESQWTWLRSVLSENGTLHDSKDLVVMMAVPLVFVGTAADQMLQKHHDQFLSLWDNYPEEQATLLTLLNSWKANGTDRQVTIVAGDVALGSHFSILFDGKKELSQLVVGPTGPWQYDPDMLKLSKQLAGHAVNVTGNISFILEHEVLKSNFGVLRLGGAGTSTQELYVSAGHGATRLESSIASGSETEVQSEVTYHLGRHLQKITVLFLLATVALLQVTDRWHRWSAMIWGIVGVSLWSAFYQILKTIGLQNLLEPGEEAQKCYPAWAEEADGTFNPNATCPFGTVIFPGVTMPDEPTLDEVFAVSYSLVPVLIGLGLLARVLLSLKSHKAFETKVTAMCILFFGVLLQMDHYVQGLQLVESQRPHLSCNVTCGMPSGHCVLAVGLLTYLILDAWHRVWPRSVSLECAPLAFATATSEWPFLEGDVITGSTFVLKVSYWSLLLLPIPWSRLKLYDHSPFQVDIGCFLGLTLGVLWFFLVHLWMVSNHWRLGGRAFGLLYHNHAAPHFRMRALAVSAVVETYPGGKDAIMRDLKNPPKRKLLAESVAAWQRQLELCLRERALAQGIRYSRQSWLFEVGPSAAAATYGKSLLEEAREKMPKEEKEKEESAPSASSRETPPGEGAAATAGEVGAAVASPDASPAEASGNATNPAATATTPTTAGETAPAEAAPAAAIGTPEAPAPTVPTAASGGAPGADSNPASASAAGINEAATAAAKPEPADTA